MKKDTFENGDLVRLKSGGPTMTVANEKPAGRNGYVMCQWFGGKKLEHGFFSPESLVPSAEDDDAKPK